MNEEHVSCEKCGLGGGCTARHTDERAMEEASAAPYLLFAAIAVVLMSLLVKWML
ncbi:MAG TPA: hypothetical protein VK463_04135 [Desulfomonilaceae bacterium]|nr:hypothetical protein [Desulfomonilaceae bacterium]